MIRVAHYELNAFRVAAEFVGDGLCKRGADVLTDLYFARERRDLPTRADM
jgi:hypothetical protein